MTYATQNDLIDYYGEARLVDLTDRGDVATGMIDSASVEQALEHATAEVDGYLSGRYVLPLSEIPSTLVDLTCILALWRLSTHNRSESLKQDYEAAQKKLDKIASGKFRLTVEAVQAETTSAGGARVTDRERPMTEDTLKGFI